MDKLISDSMMHRQVSCGGNIFTVLYISNRACNFIHARSLLGAWWNPLRCYSQGIAIDDEYTIIGFQINSGCHFVVKNKTRK